MKIGEILIHEGLLTPSQLETALTAQRIFGGRLGTNLVEHGFVSEVDLARVLARQLGVKMVDPGALANVDRRVLALVPPDVARKYAVVPFAHDEATDRVSIALADPNNLQKLDEIQFALGRRTELHIAPEVMLAFALEKYYGVERQRRYIRIGGVTDGELQLSAEVRPAPGSSAPPQARRTGRLSREDLLAIVVAAPSKQDLVASVTAALSGFGEQVAFLAIAGEALVGWEGRGLGVSIEQLRATSLPLGSGHAVARAAATCADLVGPLDAPSAAWLEQSLGMDCAGGAALLPLIVNQKAFGVFVLARLAPTITADLPLVRELLKRVSYKLQIFFLTTHLTAPL